MRSKRGEKITSTNEEIEASWILMEDRVLLKEGVVGYIQVAPLKA